MLPLNDLRKTRGGSLLAAKTEAKAVRANGTFARSFVVLT